MIGSGSAYVRSYMCLILRLCTNLTIYFLGKFFLVIFWSLEICKNIYKYFFTNVNEAPITQPGEFEAEAKPGDKLLAKPGTGAKSGSRDKPGDKPKAKPGAKPGAKPRANITTPFPDTNCA